MPLWPKRTPADPQPEPQRVSTETTAAADVFTPSVPAARAFVGRQTEMKDLKNKGLSVPGTQVVVWGESGAGKSSLVQKVLDDTNRTAVQTACTPDSTYKQILEAAFAGTGAFYITETTDHTDVNLAVASSLGSELVGAKVTGSAEYQTGQGATRQPLARPQLSPQLLLSELGKRKLSWVIEDFHKVAKPVRDSIAHALKVFSDGGRRYPDTTVIVLGVSDSLEDLVAANVNVGLRLIDIPVPPLPIEDLRKILEVGEDLLNIDFAAIQGNILDFAVGTASIAHAIALACCDERDITETADETVVFTKDDLGQAIQGYARTRSSSLRSRFNAALLVHRTRKFANPELILRALSKMPVEGASFADILAAIHRDEPTYPSSNLTNYLKDLQSDERGALVRKTNLNTYRFDEPLQHAFAKIFFVDKTELEDSTGIKVRIPYSTEAGTDQWDDIVATLRQNLNRQIQDMVTNLNETNPNWATDTSKRAD